MTLQTIIELIGYLGSIIVIVSMLMTSVVKLRIINTIGSLVFAGYALAIHSYPTAAMQACLITINMVGLYHLLNTKKEYSTVLVKPGDVFLNHFLEKNNDDIKRFFPDFTAPEKGDSVFLVCNGTIPAGVLIGTKEKDKSMKIKIDYTTPAYRDCSVGKYMYVYLEGMGIKKLETECSSNAHSSYLTSMGFLTSSDGKTFIKKL